VIFSSQQGNRSDAFPVLVASAAKRKGAEVKLKDLSRANQPSSKLQSKMKLTNGLPLKQFQKSCDTKFRKTKSRTADGC
jgi:hypothetical protein